MNAMGNSSISLSRTSQKRDQGRLKEKMCCKRLWWDLWRKLKVEHRENSSFLSLAFIIYYRMHNLEYFQISTLSSPSLHWAFIKSFVIFHLNRVKTFLHAEKCAKDKWDTLTFCCVVKENERKKKSWRCTWKLKNAMHHSFWKSEWRKIYGLRTLFTSLWCAQDYFTVAINFNFTAGQWELAEGN